MKAIQFAHHGEPKDVLAVTDKPLPEPGEHEIRVRILLSPINPSDLLYVRGHYSGVTPTFPASVGFEGVGVVDALGPGVQNLTVASASLPETPRAATGLNMPSFPQRRRFGLRMASPTSRWPRC
jgi:NADPH:quinone reductase-like Zn-dependent oxidoreductase